MQGTRLSEAQMRRIVHEAEALGNVRDVGRQHTIADQTVSRWRRQCGGMAVAEAKRLRALPRENAAWQRLVGALPRENRMLPAVRGKTWSAGRPSARR